MGALFATLAHWTVAAEEAATIAMPTGTGKTETMLALLVNGRLSRVLVVVPNSALREQIANKFLMLGVLKRAGVVAEDAPLPVVGLVEHRFPDADVAEAFLRSCNVIVATMQAVTGCTEEVRRKISELCSHLFIDEAHHVKAPTWDAFRRQFHGKPIVQFTATPFREDGKPIGGRMIYCYPLRRAQEENYFKPIIFRSDFTHVDPDRRIAETAVDQLRKDRDAELDHLVMARVDTIDRAREVHAIYEEIAPEFAPLCIHSEMGERQKREAIARLRARSTRIIVCVDMLGEGFDLPHLKIAALHDIHKSLAITLQFTGRFTRTVSGDGSAIGDATMIANRARPNVREQLRALYAEDADWNRIIRELAEGKTEEERARSEFQQSFGALPDEVPIQNVEPKMSAVVFRMAEGMQWNPEAIDAVFPPEERLTKTIARSEEHKVIWFVTREAGPVTWGEVNALHEPPCRAGLMNGFEFGHVMTHQPG
jgi:superfamily II DNA or RNA helicase